MKKEYYKLVRDNIPEIMRKEGELPKIAVMTDKEYRNELGLKLQEECNELLSSYDISEFADVLEVLEAIAKSRSISWDKVLEEKVKKANKKGKFDKKVFLMYSEC